MKMMFFCEFLNIFPNLMKQSPQIASFTPGFPNGKYSNGSGNLIQKKLLKHAFWSKLLIERKWAICVTKDVKELSSVCASLLNFHAS